MIKSIIIGVLIGVAFLVLFQTMTLDAAITIVLTATVLIVATMAVGHFARALEHPLASARTVNAINAIIGTALLPGAFRMLWQGEPQFPGWLLWLAFSVAIYIILWHPTAWTVEEQYPTLPWLRERKRGRSKFQQAYDEAYAEEIKRQ